MSLIIKSETRNEFAITKVVVGVPGIEGSTEESTAKVLENPLTRQFTLTPILEWCSCISNVEPKC